MTTFFKGDGDGEGLGRVCIVSVLFACGYGGRVPLQS